MPAYFLEIIVVALGLLVLMVEAFAPMERRSSIAWLGVLGLVVTFCLLFAAEGRGESDHVFWSFYTADRLALFYKGLALLCTIVVLLLAVDYRGIIQHYVSPETGADDDNDAGIGEFFALPIFACAGLMWMASANNLVSIFVALETVTMAFYILVAYMRRNVGSLEAGVKYLILGALSTGFLVYGFVWLFGITGETSLPAIAEALRAEDVSRPAALFAFGMILVALCFKVGAVPFHIWIPDVYQGAPTPVTAFLSVGSKAAGFLVLLRLVDPFLASEALSAKAVMVFTVLAGATMIFGNLAALPQSNFKRLLAYSSVSHAGFLMMAVAAAPDAPDSLSPAAVVSFYLAAYLLMTLLAFVVVVQMRVRQESEDLSAYNGLARTSPFLAFALLIAVASLAGVPLTAGFFGKFLVFSLAIREQLWGLVTIGLLGAICGFYYYLKVVRSMYWESPADNVDTSSAPPISLPTRIAAMVLLLATLLFGIYPKPILDLLS